MSVREFISAGPATWWPILQNLNYNTALSYSTYNQIKKGERKIGGSECISVSVVFDMIDLVVNS